jgi:hypothetical protein
VEDQDSHRPNRIGPPRCYRAARAEPRADLSAEGPGIGS